MLVEQRVGRLEGQLVKRRHMDKLGLVHRQRMQHMDKLEIPKHPSN